jgi:hypothetical protein
MSRRERSGVLGVSSARARRSGSIAGESRRRTSSIGRMLRAASSITAGRSGESQSPST